MAHLRTIVPASWGYQAAFEVAHDAAEYIRLGSPALVRVAAERDRDHARGIPFPRRRRYDLRIIARAERVALAHFATGWTCPLLTDSLAEFGPPAAT